MWKVLDAELFVQAPSDIEFRDGVFHCIERYSDEFFIKKVYTPAMFIAAIAAANAALAKWQREQGEKAAYQLYPVAKLSG